MSVHFDNVFEKFDCTTCTDKEKFIRNCGLASYTGDKSPVEPNFKIQFGKKIIHECPNSYCDWTYVGDAVQSWQYYNAGYLPETWDSQRNCQASILDQTDFFTTMATLVEATKNKMEAKMNADAMKKNKTK